MHLHCVFCVYLGTFVPISICIFHTYVNYSIIVCYAFMHSDISLTSQHTLILIKELTVFNKSFYQKEFICQIQSKAAGCHRRLAGQPPSPPLTLLKTFSEVNRIVHSQK